MEISDSKFQKYVFVCERERNSNEACCAPEGVELRYLLKEEIKKRGLSSKIRVSQAGCLDVCSDGPNVLVMPDNIWIKQCHLGDVDRILEIVMR